LIKERLKKIISIVHFTRMVYEMMIFLNQFSPEGETEAFITFGMTPLDVYVIKDSQWFLKRFNVNILLEAAIVSIKESLLGTN
jgi:hypothetical protein